MAPFGFKAPMVGEKDQPHGTLAGSPLPVAAGEPTAPRSSRFLVKEVPSAVLVNTDADWAAEGKVPPPMKMRTV